MQYKQLRIFLILTAGGILSFACRTKQAISKPIEKTAFYTLTELKDSVTKKTTFKITNIQIADTKINYRVDEDKAKDPYYLKIEITDKSKMVTNAIAEHPLFKRFDLYSESGEIESKSISLQQGEVTFRVPYFSDYKKIKITEVINRTEQKPITITHEK